MAEWTTCPHCQLRHTRRADAVCPRCHQAVDSAAVPATPASAASTGPAAIDDRTDWEKPTTWFFLAGALVFGILGAVVIGPHFFPRTGPGINVAQAMCVGACAGLGGLIGHFLGTWIDKSKGMSGVANQGGMTAPSRKRPALFAAIRSREDALAMTRTAAYGFYGVGAMQAVVGIFLDWSLIIDGLIFAILALCLHKLGSRVAALLLCAVSSVVFLSTAGTVLGVWNEGGRNIILAVIMLIVSVRAVEATFKLQSGAGYPEEPAEGRRQPATQNDPVAAASAPPALPRAHGDAERRRIELTRASARSERTRPFRALAQEPDLSTRLRFAAAQCAFDASGLRARTSDGRSRPLPWSQLAEVCTRILPSDAPWDSALIVDFVPAATEGQPAVPIRLLPFTAMTFRALPGPPASSRKENLRRLIAFALSQNPAAAVEPQSAAFVQGGTECPRFGSIAQFNDYDARYG